MNAYRIYDTFNNRVISNHRTIEAAVKAESKFSARVKKANGRNSYIPTRIEVCDDSAKAWVAADQDEVMHARHMQNL